MAYTTIDKPTDYFNTVLYTGDLQDSDGTGHTQSITGVGFTPDWVWHKGRSNARTHILVDSVRGLTNYNWLITNSNSSEITANTNGAIKSIDSDGITLENGTDSSSKSNNAGKNGETWVFWNWKAGGTASSNTDGSITSSVSANTTAGFSIVSYTGTGSNATVGHGLGAVPQMIIVKNRDGGTDNWAVYHKELGKDKWLKLNTTDASATDTIMWNDTTPTSSVFSVGTYTNSNGNTNGMIAYCFAEKKGYSKFGSYTGNGNADGTFIYTGFKPAFILIKANRAEDWALFDNKRDTFNVADHYIAASAGSAENSNLDTMDILSNGFKIRTTGAYVNFSGTENYYMAFAEAPFVTSTGIPTPAR